MSFSLTKSNFNAGIWSPSMYCRYNNALYSSAVRQMINAYSPVQGISIKRPGMKYICEAISHINNSRLVKFEYSPTQSYAIEIGVKDDNTGVFRFYTNGGRIVVDGNNKIIQKATLNDNRATIEPYEVEHPYAIEDIPRLYCEVQSYDILYIYHPNYKARMLIRTGHTNWELKEISYGSSVPPVANLHIKEESQLKAEDVIVDYVVTAVDVLQREGIQSNTANGKVTDTLVWDIAPEADYYNIYQDKNQSGQFYFIGQSRATTFTEQEGGTTEDRSKTPPQQRLPFESENNYPSCGCFKDQRMVVANTDNTPNMIAGSVTGDFYNMNISEPLQDNDAYTLLIDAQQALEVRWLWNMKVIIIGGSTGLWILQASGESGTITPSSFSLVPSSKERACYIPPAQIGNAVIFVDASRTKVRDLIYTFQDAEYNSESLTINAEHLFLGDQILGNSFQKFPNSTLYNWHESGKLTSLAYSRMHKVCGWAEHHTKGKWKSVTTTDTDGGKNETYCSVQRTIQGINKNYIEMFMGGNITNQVEQCFYVDSGLQKEFTKPVKTITGLDHLEGETIQGMMGDEIVKGLVVKNGQITLPYSVTGWVTLGLHYEHLIELLDFTIPVAGSENIMERIRKISHVGCNFTNSGDYEFSVDGKKWVYVSTGWDEEFVSGEIKKQALLSSGDTSRVWIRANNPTPFVLNSVTVDITIGDIT